MLLSDASGHHATVVIVRMSAFEDAVPGDGGMRDTNGHAGGGDHQYSGKQVSGK